MRKNFLIKGLVVITIVMFFLSSTSSGIKCVTDQEQISTIKNQSKGDRFITNLKSNWNLFTLPFNQSVDISDLYIKCDSIILSWTEATTSNNPWGYPIINKYVHGWDASNQMYQLLSTGDTIDPGKSYWIFSYCEAELWAHNVNAGNGNKIYLDEKWNFMGLPIDYDILKYDLFFDYRDYRVNWTQATTSENPWGYPIISGYIYEWNTLGQMYNFIYLFESGSGAVLYARVDGCSIFIPS
jgi:hypothetical protein